MSVVYVVKSNKYPKKNRTVPNFENPGTQHVISYLENVYIYTANYTSCEKRAF